MKLESFKSIFFKAIMSGFMIGIGGTVYLMCDNKYMGGFLFSFGLFTIIQLGFALYTGKVGYIPERKPVYIREVLITLLGNIVGTGITALMISATRIGAKVHENAIAAMDTKLGDGIVSRLILGFFCGTLMYLAVENGRNCREKGHDTSMIFGTAVPVMLFIFCGFNHSIADCFYYFSAGATVSGALYILEVAVGNALGGMFIPFMKRLFDKPDSYQAPIK